MSLQNWWALAELILICCIFAIYLLFSANLSFLLQIIFQPSFLFLFLLPFSPVLSSTSSFPSINHNIWLYSIEISKDDVFDELYSLSILDLKVLFCCLFEVQGDVAVRLADIGREKDRRLDAHDMCTLQLLSLFQADFLIGYWKEKGLSTAGAAGWRLGWHCITKRMSGGTTYSVVYT